MNIRNKRLSIRKGRDNWRALNELDTKSFGFKVEGPNTYIWTNNNATASGIIALKDKVEDGRCFKVKAKSYELFQGSWFVTHENGDIYYLNGCEVTVPYFNKHGYEAYLVKGNDVVYKKAKQGDYLTPHLCFGFAVICKSFLDYLRKEIEYDTKNYGKTEAAKSQATYELEQIEAYINHTGVKIWHTHANF